MAAPALAPPWTSQRPVGRVGRGRTLAKPLAPVAFRLPTQVKLGFPAGAPRLYVHEGARQALERRLAAAFPGPVVLSITDNRHCIVTHRTKEGVLRARVHFMFLDAPPEVKDALVRYLAAGDREASAIIGRFIDESGGRVDRRRPRHVRLVTLGRHHDLLDIFRSLNDSYFNGEVTAAVTWGKKAPIRGVRRTSIKLGSYSAVDRLIRVHPLLDRASVPRYFVAYVLYHEMLHHLIPPRRSEGGRSLLHPPEFTALERRYRFYERAMAWEKRHISRLLRTR